MKRLTFMAGIAIFSMFFGAGNVIFPLKVGLLAGNQLPYALLGLLLTAIGGPLLGLIAATLYKGNCLDFFCRPGKLLGFLFISISLLLLGPCAVIPRCFVVAYSSFTSMCPASNLFLFSLLFGALSIACCLKQNLILPLLGRFFSPLLIFSLLIIIAIGIATGSAPTTSEFTRSAAFLRGLEEGFDTMDLIAALFFSSSIWTLLWLKLQSEKGLAKIAISSSLIGGTLLGLIYLGLAFATANHHAQLATTAPEKLMPTLALLTLGPIWSHLANFAIIMACFTTVVGLTQTIASLCTREFFPNTLSTQSYMIGIIAIAIAFSNLGFARISSLIHPAISICYPAIIALTLCNLFHKLYGYQTIKRPVYAIFALSLLLKFLH